MASDISSPTNSHEDELALTWSGRWRLRHRILAVNFLTLAFFALSILTLDAYRNSLERERRDRLAGELSIADQALALSPEYMSDEGLRTLVNGTDMRIRRFDADGNRIADNWAAGAPTYQLRDPGLEGWQKSVARSLDRGFNFLVGAEKRDDFIEPDSARADHWPEIAAAKTLGKIVTATRTAPDLTPVFSAALPLEDGGALFATVNDRDVTRAVRSQRGNLALALAFAFILATILSQFLARTIVRPIQRISEAALRVRLGRARQVVVPRLPNRNDEIGTLARAISDMSQSLRMRIDKMEAFAADVTHELKNPLASLRSATDSLERIEDPALRKQLVDVIRQDVTRLDRLIGDVGEAARTDAELARAAFDPVDIGALVAQLVKAWEERRETGNVRIAFARPRAGSTIVMGEEIRLARAIDNIIDNAISFSPPGSLVEVGVAKVGKKVVIHVDDEGPGVPNEMREAIFNRFHSVRPPSEEFGRHSGLGLAIARAIVEGHDGEIDVSDRDDAPSGARFTIILEASEEAK